MRDTSCRRRNRRHTVSFVRSSFLNPFERRGNYIATSNNMKLVHWLLMGGLLHLLQRGRDWALFAVPNVTAHPSTASVPITALLYRPNGSGALRF